MQYHKFLKQTQHERHKCAQNAYKLLYRNTVDVIKASLNRRFCVNKQFIDVGFKHVTYTKPNRFYVDKKDRTKKKSIRGVKYYEIYDCGYEIMEMNIT